jgi:hypothetical protein
MSAGDAIQAAVAASLDAVAELGGVFDGPPARAAYPYATIDAATETDWSHKSGAGREVLIGLTVWDDQPVRLRALADAAEALVSNVSAVEGWQLVTMRFLRRRVVRDVAGPWAAAIEFRARMLALA